MPGSVCIDLHKHWYHSFVSLCVDFNSKSSVHIKPENSQWLQDWGKKSIFCYYLYKFVACVKLVQTRLSLELVQVLDIILMPRYFHSCLNFIHTLCVHYAHAAANLNSGNSKYACIIFVQLHSEHLAQC